MVPELSLDEDLAGRPVGMIRVAEPTSTPHGQPDPDLVCVSLPVGEAEIPTTVDAEFLNHQIPEDARKPATPVELAPGVQLFAYRLPETAEEGGILELSTWWRVTGQVKSNVMLAFHISPDGDTPRRGTPWYTRHDAADWTVPFARVEPGTIIKDQYPARLAGLPAGPCKVYAVVMDTTRPEGNRILAEPHLMGQVEIAAKTD